MTERFKVVFIQEALDFLDTLDEKSRAKVIYNIRKSQVVNDNELFKKLSDEIWEFRTLFNKSHIRLFAFWDKTSSLDTLVIATHGIIKKSAKTPKIELNKAERLRQEYLKSSL